MKHRRNLEADREEAKRIYNRELPAMVEAAESMAVHLAPLSDLGKQHSLCILMSGWIQTVCQDDMEMALQLSEFMREQVDKYIHLDMDTEAAN